MSSTSLDTVCRLQKLNPPSSCTPVSRRRLSSARLMSLLARLYTPSSHSSRACSFRQSCLSCIDLSSESSSLMQPMRLASTRSSRSRCVRSLVLSRRRRKSISSPTCPKRVQARSCVVSCARLSRAKVINWETSALLRNPLLLT